MVDGLALPVWLSVVLYPPTGKEGEVVLLRLLVSLFPEVELAELVELVVSVPLSVELTIGGTVMVLLSSVELSPTIGAPLPAPDGGGRSPPVLIGRVELSPPVVELSLVLLVTGVVLLTTGVVLFEVVLFEVLLSVLLVVVVAFG